MLRINWLWVIGLMLFIVLTPGLVGLVIRAIPSGFQPSSDGTIKVYGSHTVSQEVWPGEYFSGIALSIKNPNLINKDDLIVEVEQGGEVLRQVTLTGGGIEDGNYVKIRWPAITGSAGKSYTINFLAPAAIDSEALSLVTTDHKTDELGRLIIADEPAVDQGLALVTFSQPKNPLAISGYIYQSLTARFWSDWGFGLFYLVGIGAITVMLFKPESR